MLIRFRHADTAISRRTAGQANNNRRRHLASGTCCHVALAVHGLGRGTIFGYALAWRQPIRRHRSHRQNSPGTGRYRFPSPGHRVEDRVGTDAPQCSADRPSFRFAPFAAPLIRPDKRKCRHWVIDDGRLVIVRPQDHLRRKAVAVATVRPLTVAANVTIGRGWAHLSASRCDSSSGVLSSLRIRFATTPSASKCSGLR